MKRSRRNTIALLPLGTIPASVTEAIGEGLSSAYGFETSLLEGVPLPVDALNIDRHQHLSVLVIQEIVRMGLDAMVLGIANEDLYAQGLQFVFGEADYEKNVAVISLARLRKEFYGGQPDDELLIERAVKEAVHEVGHLIGLPHCPNPQCVMRYSNTLTHTDQKSAELCEVCRKRPGLMGA